MNKKRIAIFASGSGTNAQNINQYFASGNIAEVCLILSDRKDAYVNERAKQLGIPDFIFTMDEFKNGKVLEKLHSMQIDLIVLAGFLKLIPENIIKSFPGKIINLHPALLPKYGGKGMYGSYVHEAVIANGEKESGISIHYVNAKYDEGDIIFQVKCKVLPGDTPESLAKRVHNLEYEHYPRVILEILQKI